MEYATLADIPRPEPREYPKLWMKGKEPYLEAKPEIVYRIPANPIKAMGLLHHLAGKNYCDAAFLHRAIAIIAEARKWPIHPF